MQYPGQPPQPTFSPPIPGQAGAPPGMPPGMPPDTTAPPQFAQPPNMLPQAMGGQPMQASPEVHDPQSQLLAHALGQMAQSPHAAQTPAGAGVLADMLSKMSQDHLMHPQGSGGGITTSPNPGVPGMGAPSALDGTGAMNQIGQSPPHLGFMDALKSMF